MSGPWQNIDPRRIPVVGNDIYQAGQVYNIMSQPCGPDPWIAVQAFWSYTPMLLWSLVKPDYGDLTFQRQGRNHRRVRRRNFRIDGSMLAPTPNKPGVSMALFRGYQIFQRLGWYLIVADAATDFAVNWTSMAYSWSGCHVAGVPWATAEGGPISMGGYSGEWTAPYNAPDLSWDGRASASPGFAAIDQPGPKTCSATVTTRVVPWNGSDPEVLGATLRRNWTGPDRKAIPMSPSGNPKGVCTWSGVDSLLDANAPNTTWLVDIHCRDPWLHIEGGKIHATGAPSWGLDHDP